MGRPRSFDEQAVVATAGRQFRKTGYAGTSVDDVSAATGVLRGSLYAAFGNKRSLFLRTFADYCKRTEPALCSALSGPDDQAAERLRTYLLGAARFVLEDEERLGCMATKLATEFGGRDAEVTRRIDATFRVVEEALAGCVEAAQRNGDLDPGADPRAIARLIHATGRGLDVMARTGRGAAELDAIAESALASLPFAPGRRPAPWADGSRGLATYRFP